MANLASEVDIHSDDSSAGLQIVEPECETIPVKKEAVKEDGEAQSNSTQKNIESPPRGPKEENPRLLSLLENVCSKKEPKKGPESDCVIVGNVQPPSRKRGSSNEGSPKSVKAAKKTRPLPDLNVIADFANPPPPLVPRHQSFEIQTNSVDSDFDDSDFVVEEPSFIVPYLRHGKRQKTWKEMLVEEEAEEDEKEELEGDEGLEKQKNCFEEPIGSFLFSLGLNLVQEFVGEETLRVQKRKSDKGSEAIVKGISETLEKIRNGNAHLILPKSKCELCPFRSSSRTVIDHHKEVPHVFDLALGVFGCNFCEFTSKSISDLLEHVRSIHRQLLRIEKPEVKFQCPFCPWEDKHKPRYRKHIENCEKKFDVNKNLVLEWDLPGKTPPLNLKVDGGKKGVVWKVSGVPFHMLVPKEHVKAANAFIAAASKPVKLPKGVPSVPHGGTVQPQGEPQAGQPTPHAPLKVYEKKKKNIRSIDISESTLIAQQVAAVQQARALQQLKIPGRSPNQLNGQAIKVGSSFSLVPSTRGSSDVAVLPSSEITIRPISNGKAASSSVRSNNDPVASSSSVSLPFASANVDGRQQAVNLRLTLPPTLTIETVNGPIQNKPVPRSSSTIQTVSHQNGFSSSSVSITPVTLKKAKSSSVSASTGASSSKAAVASVPVQMSGVNCSSFVVCEICDGYVKDQDQMWTHLQSVHKVSLHPRLMRGRPPLNCQKCKGRFFTDQGLERHLLGAHGLVTAHMQENADKGRDAGRCPICGKMLAGKLLDHVKQVHNMQVKPAQLSYKCTVCAEIFYLYRDFEEHVFSLHTAKSKRKAENAVNEAPDGETESKKTKVECEPVKAEGSPKVPAVNGKPSNLNGILRIPDEITIIPQGRAEKKPSSGARQKERANAANVLPPGIKFGSSEITVTRKPAIPVTDGDLSNGRKPPRSVMPELKKL